MSEDRKTMITNKRKIKILQMFIKEIKNFEWSGLCSINIYLFSNKEITREESAWVRNLLREKRPANSGLDYYWKKSIKKPRIMWLKKKIKEIEENVQLNI